VCDVGVCENSLFSSFGSLALLINDVHLHFLLLYKKKFEETFTDKEEKERKRERERDFK